MGGRGEEGGKYWIKRSSNYFQVEIKGLTGPIEFKEGERVHFKLDLLKLKAKKVVKVGEWSPNTGVNITDRAVFFYPIDSNVTLVVTTILVIDDDRDDKISLEFD